MKKLLLILLCVPIIGFGQSSSEAMQKLREIKELLDLKLITQNLKILVCQKNHKFEKNK